MIIACLLSTNADDFNLASVVSSVASDLFQLNWGPQLTAHMRSSASLLGGPGVALVSQPASGRDASRRFGTRATMINHAQRCCSPDVESLSIWPSHQGVSLVHVDCCAGGWRERLRLVSSGLPSQAAVVARRH